MAEDSDLERTEPASARRLEQAREKGQVPRSREIGAFLVLIVAAAIFWSLGPWLAQRTMAVVRHGLTLESPLLHEPQYMAARLSELALDGLLAISPLLAALVIAALISPFFLGSWIFSTQSLVPDLTRLDPIKGLGRVISWSGIVELFKALAKAGLIAGVAAWVIWSERGQIFALYGQSIETGLAGAGDLIVFSFFAVVAGMLLIVAIDVPFQLWQYYDKLKMSKEEVKQEYKEMEGDPQIKARVRAMQREAARRRMMGAVPTADVVVTNPTHFAIALSYKSGMTAPKLVAKGRGEIALKIREIGAANGVPLLEAPPLARALYKHVDLEQEIPSALYAAVAEVLAYVHQLSQWRQGAAQYPVAPREIAVPSELMTEAAYG